MTTIVYALFGDCTYEELQAPHSVYFHKQHYLPHEPTFTKQGAISSLKMEDEFEGELTATANEALNVMDLFLVDSPSDVADSIHETVPNLLISESIDDCLAHFIQETTNERSVSEKELSNLEDMLKNTSKNLEDQATVLEARRQQWFELARRKISSQNEASLLRLSNMNIVNDILT